MSEHITHVAVYEDMVRLMMADKGGYPEAFITSLEKSYDCGLMCSGANKNHLFAIPILEKYKNRNPEGLTRKETEQIAGSIGWLTHRASDLQMKPVFAIVAEKNHPVFKEDECEMYCDAVIFKQIYQGGRFSSNSPYEIFSTATLEHQMKSNPAAAFLDVGATENLLTHFLMRELVNQQHFIDKTDEIDLYCDLLIEQSQSLYEDLRMYINAFQNPDPQKMIDFIYNFNVYDENDALIKVVRNIQVNKKYPSLVELNEAFNTAESQSHYARSLKMAYEFVISAGKFYDGKISKPEVYDILQIFTEAHRI